MSEHRQSSRFLINERAVYVLPSLACKYGLHEAIVLQQIHYWLQSSKHVHEGRHWVYNSYTEWQAKHFPFLSVHQIRRAIEHLEQEGILLAAHFNERGFDRTKWYTIDYDRLEQLAGPEPEPTPAPDSDDDPDLEPAASHLAPLPNRFGTTSPMQEMPVPIGTHAKPSGTSAKRIGTHAKPIPETNTETNNRERETHAQTASEPYPNNRGMVPAPRGDTRTPSPSRRTRTVVTLYQPEATGDISLIAPVACESPAEPEVTIPVPRGTPVNRRPDAPPVLPRPKPAPIPPDWTPDAPLIARAVEMFPHLTAAKRTALTRRFVLHYQGEGKPAVNWGAKWLEWLDREADYGRKDVPAGPAPPRAAAPNADLEELNARRRARAEGMTL